MVLFEQTQELGGRKVQGLALRNGTSNGKEKIGNETDAAGFGLREGLL